MSKTVKILIGVLAAIVVLACVALALVWFIIWRGDASPADPLTGTKWQVRSYYDAAGSGGMASPPV